MKICLLILTLCATLFYGCKKEELLNDCQSIGAFISPEGKEFYIYKDGTAYVNNNGSCEFAIQYFDPDFLTKSYKIDATGKYLITEGGLLPIKNEFLENFENYAVFSDLFLKSVADKDLYWTSFTLLSPAAPTIKDYVNLRKCVLSGTCNFIDNKLELASDPTNATNKVLKFTSVAPTPSMITAKASVESEISFFDKGSNLWFQADYYVESGTPFSLVDFESAYFYERPGPRVVIRNSILSVEYFQTSPISIPAKKWFTVKVHFKFSNESDGIIEIWQDARQIISAKGINSPLFNAIQNSIEVGITATSVDCVLLMDNIRISASPF